MELVYKIQIEIIDKNNNIEKIEKTEKRQLKIKTKRQNIEIIKIFHKNCSAFFGFAEKGIDEFLKNPEEKIVQECLPYLLKTNSAKIS